MHTDAIQDYLKTIYDLAGEAGRATTSAVATRLGVAPASATGMLKRLAARQLVEHQPHRGAVLTAEGRRAALLVIRHHRLLELYLAERLGVPLEQVHAEADRLEHALSPALAERLDELLGRPACDPHGAPIPSAAGEIAARAQVPLGDLAPGECAVVVEVRDHDRELVRHLGVLGLLPGATVTAVGRAPFAGPLTVRTGGVEHAVGETVATSVFVRREEMGT